MNTTNRKRDVRNTKEAAFVFIIEIDMYAKTVEVKVYVNTTVRNIFVKNVEVKVYVNTTVRKLFVKNVGDCKYVNTTVRKLFVKNVLYNLKTKIRNKIMIVLNITIYYTETRIYLNPPLVRVKEIQVIDLINLNMRRHYVLSLIQNTHTQTISYQLTRRKEKISKI